jgi:hypothetical protein
MDLNCLQVPKVPTRGLLEALSSRSSGSKEVGCKRDGSQSYDIAITGGRAVVMALELPLSRWMTTWMQWQSVKDFFGIQKIIS